MLTLETTIYIRCQNIRLKKFIKKKWHENEDFIAREFKMYLEWCVDVCTVPRT
jgi:hypothetical protein